MKANKALHPILFYLAIQFPLHVLTRPLCLGYCSNKNKTLESETQMGSI